METEITLMLGKTQLIIMMVGLWVGGLLLGIGLGAKLNNKNDTGGKT